MSWYTPYFNHKFLFSVSVSVFNRRYQLNPSRKTIHRSSTVSRWSIGVLSFSRASLDFPNQDRICLAIPQHVIVVHIWEACKTLHQSEMWWRPFLVNEFIFLLFNPSSGFYLSFPQPHEILWFWFPGLVHIHKKMCADCLSQRESAHGISAALMLKLK